MLVQQLMQQVDVLRFRLSQDHTDPKGLHDELCRVVGQLRDQQIKVPVDLREAVQAIEAEILEDFYDNLPV